MSTKSAQRIQSTLDAGSPRPARLGVYVDTVYRKPDRPGGHPFTNHQIFPFMQYVCEVGTHFEELVLFGREDPGGADADYELPTPARVVGLPFYDNLANARQVARATPGTIRGMWRGSRDIDVAWVCGPYPFSLVLVVSALLRRRKVILGVRQDTMAYFRERLPSRLATPALLPLFIVDRLYHLLSRWLPTMVVGEHLEQQYGGPRPGLLSSRISLVRAADVVDGPCERDWGGQVQLLTVGRIEPEKNPLLLVEAMRILEDQEPGRYRLTYVGRGQLAEAAQAHAAALGVADAIDFVGYRKFGPELLELYRSHHLFVHVAVTEAFGQVLTESMASGIPIVATSVGGVPSNVDHGRAGVLVPPNDAGAIAAAVRRVSGDRELRERLVERGLELARRHTLEYEAGRLAELAG